MGQYWWKRDQRAKKGLENFFTKVLLPEISKFYSRAFQVWKTLQGFVFKSLPPNDYREALPTVKQSFEALTGSRTISTWNRRCQRSPPRLQEFRGQTSSEMSCCLCACCVMAPRLQLKTGWAAPQNQSQDNLATTLFRTRCSWQALRAGKSWIPHGG